MEEDCIRTVIRVLNKLLDSNTRIIETQVPTLVKCITEIPGKCSHHHIFFQ